MLFLAMRKRTRSTAAGTQRWTLCPVSPGRPKIGAAHDRSPDPVIIASNLFPEDFPRAGTNIPALGWVVTQNLPGRKRPYRTEEDGSAVWGEHPSLESGLCLTGVEAGRIALVLGDLSCRGAFAVRTEPARPAS